MKLSKFLKSGKILINSTNKYLEIEGKDFIFSYEAISNTEWGDVYEKYAGQIFEQDGYSVTYRGLINGFRDNGIDLIMENEKEIIYAQCKYQKKYFSKQNIEWILYKASKELFKASQTHNKTLIFCLIFNSIDENFSQRVPKGFNIQLDKKIKYPLLEYFLSHNYTQNKVKLT